MGRPREPLHEPDLTSQARATNIRRLLGTVEELDAVADAAAGKLVQPDIVHPWLRPLAAPRYGANPSSLLQRWRTIFEDDYEAVERARNNIVYSEPISDENVAAAAQIAERILHLVKDAHLPEAAGDQENQPERA